MLGRDPDDPPPTPFSATSLGNGAADPLLEAAGFEPAARHNETHELRLRLGAAGSDQAWMLYPLRDSNPGLATRTAPCSVRSLLATSLCSDQSDV